MDPGIYIFQFYCPLCDIFMQNETIENSSGNDFFYIVSANTITIKSISFSQYYSPSTLTTSSGLIRVATVTTSLVIDKAKCRQCSLYSNNFILVESGTNLTMTNTEIVDSSIYSGAILSLSFLQIFVLQGLTFLNITQQSHLAPTILSIPQLNLAPHFSSYALQNVTMSNSTAGFLAMSDVNLADKSDNTSYSFIFSGLNFSNIVLSDELNLFDFGQWKYQNLALVLSDISINNCSLDQGSFMIVQVNTANVTIVNLSLTGNIGTVFTLEPKSLLSANLLKIYLKNSNFNKNNGQSKALVQMTSNSFLFVVNSTFIENFSSGRGSVIKTDYQGAYAEFIQCQFLRNYAFQGGVFFTEFRSQIVISQSQIRENFAIQGGVGFVDNDGRTEINSDSVMSNNIAGNTCLIYLTNSQLVSRVDNSTIFSNKQVVSSNLSSLITELKERGYITSTFIDWIIINGDKSQKIITKLDDYQFTSLKAKFTLSNSDIFNSDKLINSKISSVTELSNVQIHDCTLTDVFIQSIASQVTITSSILSALSMIGKQSAEMYLISVLNKSKFNFVNSSVTLLQGIPFLSSYDSSLFLSGGSQITDTINTNKLSAFVEAESSSLVLQDLAIQNMTSVYQPIIFSLLHSEIMIDQVNLTAFNATFIGAVSCSVNVTNLNVSDGDSGMRSLNSLVFDSVDSSLSISNSEFSNLRTKTSSPVVYHSNSKASLTLIENGLSVQNSEFYDNVAQLSAGVLYVLNANTSIDNCTFEGNQAMEDAGAVYLECGLEEQQCIYTVTNSNFTNNSALINGGAIKYTSYKPVLTNIYFSDNHASYGENIASFSVQLGIFVAENSTNMMLSEDQAHSIGHGDSKVLSLPDAQVSGSIISNAFQVILQDELGQNVGTDNKSVASLVAYSQNMSLSKIKTAQAVNGVFTFDQVSLIGVPGEQIMFTVEISTLDDAFVNRIYPSTKFKDFLVSLSLRYCDIGEYQTSDNKCQQCNAGFFTLALNQSACQMCPENAKCEDGYQIIVKDGYWRESINTSSIIQCLNPAACLSGFYPQCAPGYGGTLCDQCTLINGSHYFRNGLFGCAECQTSRMKSLTTLWQLIILMGYVVLVVVVSVKYIREKPEQVGILRIMTSYFQMVTIVSQYELQWQNKVVNFLKWIAYVSYSQIEVLKIDCYVKQKGYTTHPDFLRMIILLVFPLICLTFICVVVAVIKLLRKNTNASRKIFQSIIIVIYLILPYMASKILSIFKCVNVFGNGNSQMISDLGVQCWVTEHNYYAKAFGIPAAIIWILIVPLVTYMKLLRSKEEAKKNETQTQDIMGFFFVGLKTSKYYWEIVLFCEKLSLICVNIYLAEEQAIFRVRISINVQAATGFVLMCIYAEVELLVSPYKIVALHRLEAFSNGLIVLKKCQYLGHYFLSGIVLYCIRLANSSQQSYDGNHCYHGLSPLPKCLEIRF